MKKIEKYLNQKKLKLKSNGMKVTKNGETFELFQILKGKADVCYHVMESKDGDAMYYLSKDGEGYSPVKGQRDVIKALEKELATV